MWTVLLQMVVDLPQPKHLLIQRNILQERFFTITQCGAVQRPSFSGKEKKWKMTAMPIDWCKNYLKFWGWNFRVWIFWNRKKIITDKLGQCSVSYLITLFHPRCNVSDENTHVNWSWRTGTCFEMPLRKFVVYTMVHFRKKIPILVSQPFVLHAGAIKISIKSAISLAQYFLKIDRLTNSDYESWVMLKQ